MDWTPVLHTLPSDYSHGLCILPWVVFLWNVAKAQQRFCSVPRCERAFSSHPSTLWYFDEPQGALWFYIRPTFRALGHKVSASREWIREGLSICGDTPPQRPTDEPGFPLMRRGSWLGAHRGSRLGLERFGASDLLDCAEFNACSGAGEQVGRNGSSPLCKSAQSGCECCRVWAAVQVAGLRLALVDLWMKLLVGTQPVARHYRLRGQNVTKLHLSNNNEFCPHIFPPKWFLLSILTVLCFVSDPFLFFSLSLHCFCVRPVLMWKSTMN